MSKTLNQFLFAIELNLILWIIVLVGVVSMGTDFSSLEQIIWIGLILNFFIQHWAYYKVRKVLKEERMQL